MLPRHSSSMDLFVQGPALSSRNILMRCKRALPWSVRGSTARQGRWRLAKNNDSFFEQELGIHSLLIPSRYVSELSYRQMRLPLSYDHLYPCIHCRLPLPCRSIHDTVTLPAFHRALTRSRPAWRLSTASGNKKTWVAPGSRNFWPS